MGNDITLMDAKSLSILSNPAIIAISQDPLGVPAFRVWQKPGQPENNTLSANLYTQGETYLWTGKLSGGDFVVAFVNAGPSPTAMSATMDDIFIDQITTGSSKQVAETAGTWDVHDLWTNRMDDATAQAIIDGNPAVNENSTMMNSTMSTMRYNATAMSYADGLAAKHVALMGAKIGSLAPMGTLSAQVPSHGIAIYRLRGQGDGSRRRKRDEL